MTERDALEYTLIELNKREAPALLLKDFNLYWNKGTIQYCNKKYNLYDINQQTDDDLDVLKIVDYELPLTLSSRHYSSPIPSDYFHILNCEVEFEVGTDYFCYEQGDIITKNARRLTSSSARGVNDNYYFKPSYKTPYFYKNADTLEIRSGAVFNIVPKKAYIDYLRKPVVIDLTEEQVDDVEDESQLIEFPDYVCFEIMNEVIKLILEKSSDQRLQTNPLVNQSIANPLQKTK